LHCGGFSLAAIEHFIYAEHAPYCSCTATLAASSAAR
jgi:hypothetical protein